MMTMKYRLIFAFLCCACIVAASELKITTVPAPAGGRAPELLLNADNTVDLTFAPFTEKVLVTLELPAPARLRGVRISANAAPAKNFDDVLIEVAAAPEGDWQTVGSILPPGGNTVGVYSATGIVQHPEKIRFVRLTLTAPFLEIAQTLRSIELQLGEAAPLPASSEASVPSPVSGPAVILENGCMKVEISRQDGEIRTVANAGGARLLEAIAPFYHVQRRSGDTEVAASGDRVKTMREITPEEVEFTCSAGFDPSVQIIKHYQLEGDHLIRTVRFERSGDAATEELLFVTPGDRLVFPAERRSKVVLSGGDPWYSPRVNLRDVKVRTRQRGAGNSHAVMALELEHPENSLAYFRYLVNGRFVWPLSSAYSYEPGNIMNFYPEGAQVPATTLPLKSGEAVSYQAQLLFFSGSEIEFMRRYREFPEVKRAYGEIERPEWIGDTLVQLWLRSELKDDAVNQLRQLLAMTDSGDIMVILNQPFIWGDFGEKEKFRNIWGAWITEEEYIALIRELKALSPRVKVALYTWLWTVAMESDFYQENPDGFITYDRNNRIFNSYPALETSVLRKFSHKPSVDRLAEQYRIMVEKYGVDFVYLDGGKGGASVIDWRTGEVDQEYDWQDFYCYMRRLAEEYGAGGVCFNSKGNPIADAGIAEMPLDGFRNNPVFLASRIWGGKLQEKWDPGHRTVPCYWGESDPYYSNICVGMGLLPHLELAGLSPHEPEFIVRKTPLLTVMREMFRFSPVGIAVGSALDGGETPALGFELERGNTRVISLIDHSKKPEAFPVRFSAAFKDHRAWRNDLDDPDSIRDIFPEKLQKEVWRDCNWKLQHSVRSTFIGELSGEALKTPLREKLLSVVAVSKSRAVVTACDYLPTQMRFASTPDVEVETADQSDAVTGNVIYHRNDGAVVDIALLLPLGKAPSKLENAEYLGLFHTQNRSFLQLRVRGPFTVHLAAVPEKVERQLEMPSSANAGDTVAFAVRGTAPAPYSALNLYRDDRLVMSVDAAGGEFRIPGAARNGKYKVRLEDASGVSAMAELEISGAAPIELPEIPKITRPRATLTAVEHPDISAIALGGGQDEAADLETLTLQAKLLERPDTLWNYSTAGFEFRNVCYLRFKASSDITTRYCIEKRKRWAPAVAGLLVDYAVGDNYVKRVAFDFGMGGEFKMTLPEYGKGTIPDLQVKHGTWILRETEKLLSVDLGRYAPAGWKGKCIVSALLCNVLQGRELTLHLEAYSADDSSILLPEDPPEEKEQLATHPMPAVVGPEGECVITDFREPESFKAIDCPTRVLLRRGPEKTLHVRFECTEPAIDTLTFHGGAGGLPHLDDSVELYWLNAEGKIAQLISNAAGAVLSKGFDGLPLSGVAVKAEVQKAQKRFVVEMEIPASLLPDTDTLRMNFCRNRPRREEDPSDRWFHAAWARLPQLNYAMPEFFGRVHLRQTNAVEVVNAGVGGDNSDDLLARFERDVLAQNPDTVVVMCGTNDMLNSGKPVPFDRFRSNLEKLVSMLQSRKIHVVLLTTIPCYEPYLLKRHNPAFFAEMSPNRKLEQANAIIRDVAGKFNCPVADVWTLFLTRGCIGERAESFLRNPVNGDSEDGVHPVGAGYAQIAQAVLETLLASGISPEKIVCFGDSITLGIGAAAPAQAYPSILSAALNSNRDEK